MFYDFPILNNFYFLFSLTTKLMPKKTHVTRNLQFVYYFNDIRIFLFNHYHFTSINCRFFYKIYFYFHFRKRRNEGHYNYL